VRIDAAFVTSAPAAAEVPSDLPRIALVGRSNVGKSSLINALVRQKLARTSAAPGKTRLANVYRVRRGADRPVYLVDLPGYGYARRGPETETAANRGFEPLAAAVVASSTAALLLVDLRHPGLEKDRAAWAWVLAAAPEAAIVATKTDKLARGERIRALGALESVLEHAVTPVSAVTGEGLDELWKLIDRLAHSSSPLPPSNNRPPARTAAPPAPPPPPPRHRKKSSGSTSRRSRT
jgi:GTP-binding protein